MGLDLVEYALAIEDAFELSIPDDEWVALTTPGKLIDYLSAHLAVGETGPPLVQTAFYRLRRAVASELGVERRAIAPSATFRTLAPTRSERDLAKAVAARLGLDARDISHSPVRGALSHLKLVSSKTLGAIAQDLAMRLLAHEAGIDIAKVELHHTFVADLGMD